MKKDKIFIIMQSAVVNTVGGTITVFTDYCNLLVSQGYEVHGIYSAKTSNRPHGLDDNVNFVNLKYLSDEPQTFSQALNFYTEKENPDLFIFFMPSLYVKANLDSKFDKIPRILMFHGRPDYYFARVKNLEKKLKPLYKNTIAQILIPSYINLLPKYIKQQKVVYIPNSASLGCETISDVEKKKIVFLSRIAPCKGIDFLIKSFKYVVKNHPDWVLDIYGQSQPIQYKNDLQDLINKLNLQNNVKIKGISDNPLKTFLDYDFCVFPSCIEGFPMGLIESQSVGLPSVGLEGCSGVNELIIHGKNGFLSKRSYKDFAKYIIKLIENPQLRKIMSEDSVKESKKYSKAIVYQMWFDLIENILKGVDVKENVSIKTKNKYKLFSIKKVIKWDTYNPDMNLNIYQRLKKFIFNIQETEEHRIYSIAGIRIKMREKNTFNKLFSVKRIDCHKVIEIFGLKLKFKCSEYVIDNLQKQLNVLAKKIDTQKYIIDSCVDIKNFPKASGDFRLNQIANAELLKIIVSIFDKYNINYWLDFGTCLGAVRHKGFVPWDDDIDIGMLREDYNRVIPILKSELQNFDIEINEGHPRYKDYSVLRIIYKNSCIQTDIFPYDKYYKATLSEKEKIELDEKVDYAHEIFYKDIISDFYKGKTEFPRAELDEIVRNIILNDNLPVENGVLFRSLDFNYKNCKLPKIFNYSDIFPLQKIEFEGMYFSAPANFDNFLKITYGDYMKFPNIIKQHKDISSRIGNIDIENEMQTLKTIYEQLMCSQTLDAVERERERERVILLKELQSDAIVCSMASLCAA